MYESSTQLAAWRREGEWRPWRVQPCQPLSVQHSVPGPAGIPSPSCRWRRLRQCYPDCQGCDKGAEGILALLAGQDKFLPLEVADSDGDGGVVPGLDVQLEQLQPSTSRTAVRLELVKQSDDTKQVDGIN